MKVIIRGDVLKIDKIAIKWNKKRRYYWDNFFAFLDNTPVENTNPFHAFFKNKKSQYSVDHISQKFTESDFLVYQQLKKLIWVYVR